MTLTVRSSFPMAEFDATPEKIGARAVVLQLGARQQGLQVAFKNFDAEHAVDRAVI